MFDVGGDSTWSVPSGGGYPFHLAALRGLLERNLLLVVHQSPYLVHQFVKVEFPLLVGGRQLLHLLCAVQNVDHFPGDFHLLTTSASLPNPVELLQYIVHLLKAGRPPFPVLFSHGGHSVNYLLVLVRECLVEAVQILLLPLKRPGADEFLPLVLAGKVQLDVEDGILKFVHEVQNHRIDVAVAGFQAMRHNLLGCL